MKITSGLALALVTLVSLLQAACLGSPAGEDEPVGEAEEPTVVQNALTGNALTGNALTGNALTGNALTGNALTGNALTGNSLISLALEDPAAREVLKYIVSCALPDGAHIDVDVAGVTYGFDGELGLAPQWGLPNGQCGPMCRSWVSGCVMSRVDYTGQSVLISIRGGHHALASTPAERAAYPSREATYFGDIFAWPQRLFACLSPGQTQIPRVCGPSIDSCVMDVVGECDDVCGKPRKDGSFPSCRAPVQDDDDDQGCLHHHFGQPNIGSVTVFLP